MTKPKAITAWAVVPKLNTRLMMSEIYRTKEAARYARIIQNRRSLAIQWKVIKVLITPVEE